MSQIFQQKLTSFSELLGTPLDEHTSVSKDLKILEQETFWGSINVKLFFQLFYDYYLKKFEHLLTAL